MNLKNNITYLKEKRQLNLLVRVNDNILIFLDKLKSKVYKGNSFTYL